MTLLPLAEIYADPTHSSYEALQFVSGVLTTFTPNVSHTPPDLSLKIMHKAPVTEWYMFIYSDFC